MLLKNAKSLMMSMWHDRYRLGYNSINQGETALKLPFRLDDGMTPVAFYRRVKVLCCTSRQLGPTMTSNSPGSHT